MLRKNSGFMNALLVLLCIVLLGALGFLLVKDKKDSEKVVQQVEEVAEETKEEKAPPKEEVKVTPTPAVTVTPTPVVEEVKGIACWGDDLMDASTTGTYSYMAVLQRILTEKGYDLPVSNKTLQGGGTLSMMKLAGVSDNVLQGYITAHQQAANGAELYITERGIRDFTPEELKREDVDYIPIIFMGFYGGWNHDPKELAEQQEHILKTFTNQEKFLVVGTRPLDGSVGSEELDKALKEKWGEHYISLAEVTSYPSGMIEAQEAMAQAIVQKLEELSYIKKTVG